MKKLITLILILFVFCGSAQAFSLFSGSNKGQKILIVWFEDNENAVSDTVLIKNALNKGGSVVLNLDVVRELDSGFEEKYAAMDSDGRFVINAAILNFIGGQGWNFVQMQLGPQYFFVKDR